MSARDEILSRIRTALADHPDGGSVDRAYRQADPGPDAAADALPLLVERITDYKATVHQATTRSAPGVIETAVAARGARRLVVPAGFPADLLADLVTVPGIEFVHDDPLLSAADLDATDGVLTLSRLAIAETGTIVLDAGPGQGRRALTLVPDYHLCVVHAATVVRGVPEAIAQLATTDPTRPLTWISGPSATSDIELQRVEGVHGPRTLVVVLIS